jgi:hypothetical protein
MSRGAWPGDAQPMACETSATIAQAVRAMTRSRAVGFSPPDDSTGTTTNVYESQNRKQPRGRIT